MKLTLKAARINAGLTAQNVADITNVHVQTLLKYEKDSSKIPINLLNELSEVYQMPMDNIFLGKEYDLIRIIKAKREKMA